MGFLRMIDSCTRASVCQIIKKPLSAWSDHCGRECFFIEEYPGKLENTCIGKCLVILGDKKGEIDMQIKPHRVTLGEYYNSGQEIKIVGEVADRIRPVTLILDEKSCLVKPQNLVQPDYVKPIIHISRGLPTSLLGRLDWATVVKNIRGVYGFESINEDHVIIQQNLTRFMPGQSVLIYGSVVKYLDDNKHGRFDYAVIPRGFQHV